MALTLQAIEAHIRHALGGDSSVEGNGRTIANEAGHRLASMHDWRFLERLGRLSLRAPITITDGTWSESAKSLTKTSAFTNYTWVQGDEIEITGGADATTGFYQIQSSGGANVIVLETSIGAGADTDTDIDGTMALDSVALPSDFRQFIKKPWGTDSTLDMEVVEMDQILALRSGSTTSTGSMYWAALAWNRSVAADGGAPAPRLEIYPSPTANDADAFRFVYRGDWIDLTDDDDHAPLPAKFAIEALYLQVVRAVALGYEEHDQGSMDARIGEIRGGSTFRDAVYADGGITPSVGMMGGGAASLIHAAMDSGQGDSWHGSDTTVDWP